MALAEATKGAAEWDGLGLLSGSGINDITTTLSIFGSQYSTAHELANCYDVVQELPDLTGEDIEWLCGLTEATESQEPVSANVDPGRFGTPRSHSRTRPSKRRRRGNEGTATHLRIPKMPCP